MLQKHKSDAENYLQPLQYLMATCQRLLSDSNYDFQVGVLGQGWKMCQKQLQEIDNEGVLQILQTLVAQTKHCNEEDLENAQTTYAWRCLLGPCCLCLYVGACFPQDCRVYTCLCKRKSEERGLFSINTSPPFKTPIVHLSQRPYCSTN